MIILALISCREEAEIVGVGCRNHVVRLAVGEPAVVDRVEHLDLTALFQFHAKQDKLALLLAGDEPIVLRRRPVVHRADKVVFRLSRLC